MAVVLIVEDDKRDRFVADCVLKFSGYETIPVSSLYDALSVLRSNAKIDALLTDISLDNDKRAGLKVANEAINRRPGVGVVYTTGKELSAPLPEESEVLSKPYFSGHLTYAVKRALCKAKVRRRQRQAHLRKRWLTLRKAVGAD